MDAVAQVGTFLFAEFHLDRRGLFRRDAHGALAPVAIGGRASDLLRVLVERQGEILSKSEIMAAVWPNATVEDGNLTLQISALRRILDRGRSGGGCIQTVVRRGYRFAAAVTRVETEASERAATSETTVATPPPRLSIVVLPIANLSGDSDDEYFADGMTDDLTTDLSRIAGSFVIARSTASTYKGRSVDVRQIGRELGVRYVLEGSVRRADGRVRMNLQLIDAETGAHLWADRLQTDRQNLGRTEDEVIGRLAHTLNLELVAAAGRQIEDENSADPGASDLAMRGWASLYRPRSVASLEEARGAFERALALEPRSIEASIGLATVLTTMFLEGGSGPLAADQAGVEELLAAIFAREANHSMAHYAMAMLRRSQNRLTEARIAAERAVALDPNNSAALYELGLAHLHLGRPEAGISHMEKATRLSPSDPFLSAMQYGLGRCHLFLGHLEEAVALFDQIRTARPRYWDVHMWLAGALGLQGDLAAARAELAEANRLKPEIDTLARWNAHQPWTAIPQYQALREKTLNVGLRRAGFPD